VAQLGVTLGMATAAEGVETEEQLEQVRAEGCTEMQGFYVCEPSPADVIARLFLGPVGKVTASVA
jgi:EAL domain-containing protein (putative c-di-GMP-specific phosphodiesterase class I)